MASGPASGGGAAFTAGYPTIVNCLFYNNEGTFGGGIRNNMAELTIINSVFNVNKARNEGWGDGLLAYNNGADTTIINAIFWDNGNSEIAQYYGAETTVLYSDVMGGWDGLGEHNIDVDPLFVDEDSGNLHLTPESPCIDTGSTPLYKEQEGPNYDLDGNPRFVFGKRGATGKPQISSIANIPIDIGSYEYQ